MIEYSKKVVRCNFCMKLFPRKKDIEYSHPSHSTPDEVLLCPECKKGHLWLVDMEVDKEQLEKDKYNREHPPHDEIIKNAIHKRERSYTKPEPPYGKKLSDGFFMLNDDF